MEVALSIHVAQSIQKIRTLVGPYELKPGTLVFRAVNHQQATDLDTYGITVLNKSQILPTTEQEIKDQSARQINDGSYLNSNPSNKNDYVPTSCTIVDRFLSCKQMADRFPPGGGQPGRKIVSWVYTQNDKCIVLDPTQMDLLLTTKGKGGAAALHELHVFGQHSITTDDIIYENGDFTAKGQEYSAVTYGFQNSTWSEQLGQSNNVPLELCFSYFVFTACRKEEIEQIKTKKNH